MIKQYNLPVTQDLNVSWHNMVSYAAVSSARGEFIDGISSVEEQKAARSADRSGSSLSSPWFMLMFTCWLISEDQSPVDWLLNAGYRMSLSVYNGHVFVPQLVLYKFAVNLGEAQDRGVKRQAEEAKGISVECYRKANPISLALYGFPNEGNSVGTDGITKSTGFFMWNCNTGIGKWPTQMRCKLLGERLLSQILFHKITTVIIDFVHTNLFSCNRHVQGSAMLVLLVANNVVRINNSLVAVRNVLKTVELEI